LKNKAPKTSYAHDDEIDRLVLGEVTDLMMGKKQLLINLWPLLRKNVTVNKA
jgi:hypothetical protein